MIKFGFCNLCQEVETWKIVEGRLLVLPTYRDFWVGLSDGTKMRVGICDSCLDRIEKEQVNNEELNSMHERFKNHWEQELVSSNMSNQVKQMREIKIDAFDATETRIKDKMIVIAKEKRKNELNKKNESK